MDRVPNVCEKLFLEANCIASWDLHPSQHHARSTGRAGATFAFNAKPPGRQDNEALAHAAIPTVWSLST
jgi:hypothetical protein